MTSNNYNASKSNSAGLAAPKKGADAKDGSGIIVAGTTTDNDGSLKSDGKGKAEPQRQGRVLVDRDWNDNEAKKTVKPSKSSTSDRER